MKLNDPQVRGEEEGELLNLRAAECLQPAGDAAANALSDGATAVAPGGSARRLGNSLVGLRVSVWWEEDEAWYDGTVREFDHTLGEHLVAYDDGEQAHEDLDTCRCAGPCHRCLMRRGAPLPLRWLTLCPLASRWWSQVEDAARWLKDSGAREQETAPINLAT